MISFITYPIMMMKHVKMRSKIISRKWDRIFVSSQGQLHTIARLTQILRLLWAIYSSLACIDCFILRAFVQLKLVGSISWYKRPTAQYFCVLLWSSAWSIGRSPQEAAAAPHQLDLNITVCTSIGQRFFVEIEKINWGNIANVGMIGFSSIVVDWFNIVLE